MGLFTGLRNLGSKSEAAVVVQNLLEEQVQLGMLQGADPAKLANSLVAAAWDARPAIFEGGFGSRPGKLSTAAAALLHAAKAMGPEHSAFVNMVFCMNTIIQHVGNNAGLYELTKPDIFLLEECADFLRSVSGAIDLENVESAD